VARRDGGREVEVSRPDDPAIAFAGFVRPHPLLDTTDTTVSVAVATAPHPEPYNHRADRGSCAAQGASGARASFQYARAGLMGLTPTACKMDASSSPLRHDMEVQHD
jgi:hypothetical protein